MSGSSDTETYKNRRKYQVQVRNFGAVHRRLEPAYKFPFIFYRSHEIRIFEGEECCPSPTSVLTISKCLSIVEKI